MTLDDCNKAMTKAQRLKWYRGALSNIECNTIISHSIDTGYGEQTITVDIPAEYVRDSINAEIKAIQKWFQDRNIDVPK